MDISRVIQADGTVLDIKDSTARTGLGNKADKTDLTASKTSADYRTSDGGIYDTVQKALDKIGSQLIAQETALNELVVIDEELV